MFCWRQRPKQSTKPAFEEIGTSREHLAANFASVSAAAGLGGDFCWSGNGRGRSCHAADLARKPRCTSAPASAHDL